MNFFRASLAALAIAVAGAAGAGSASAKTLQPIIHFCKPHYETHTQYIGIRHIGYRFYRVYRVVVDYVDIRCHKHIVRVYYRYVPLWFFHKKGVA